jgi:threonylcarbamoyladenosine tRNA methylthiotransferase MtaB
VTGDQVVAGQGRCLGFITQGCKVNQYESAFMAETAAQLGFELTSPEESEFLVINTCTVTSRTDRQIRQILRQAARLSSQPKIIVTGCYAQRAPLELAQFPKVQAVFGNLEKASWPDLVPALLHHEKPLLQVADVAQSKQFSVMPLNTFRDRTRAFVKIQDGCNHCCSYCIVPSVRGPERSLPLTNVLEQLEILIVGGFKEIVLTGINLSRYGRDLPGGENLLTLVRRLKEAHWPVRFRFSSVEPQDLSGELLQELAQWPQFCPHFHIPLQSGAGPVLAVMGRGYQPDWFEALVQHIAALFPAAAIGLDVMVGFPTESPADFRQTRDLVARLPVSYLHVFPYSARPGTPAASLRPLADSREILARAKDLRALGGQKKRSFYQRQVGQMAEVLIEGQAATQSGWVTGLTANYVRVHVPGPQEWANQVIGVRLEEINGQALIGAAITRGLAV